jgi:GTP cyclohydrolase IA
MSDLENAPPGIKVSDPIEPLVRALLLEIGEDPDREGLRDTPRRCARWWREFVEYDPGATSTVFTSVTGGQLVAVSDINLWSICEHHLLPFSCTLCIAYLTRDHVLGLSKFARIAQTHAHRLQLQERLVHDIADEIEKLCCTPDIAVIGHGNHLCMTMRGIRTSAQMASTVWRGAFLQDVSLRTELLKIVEIA